MIGARHQPLTAAFTSDIELNEPSSFSSPPCFLHELDPCYFGYLGDDEVRELLADLLRAKLTGTRVENAWVHAMLLRQAARQNGRNTLSFGEASQMIEPDSAGSLQSLPTYDQERLESKLEDALPRLHDEVLRRDLEQVLGLLKRNRHGGERRSNG